MWLGHCGRRATKENRAVPAMGWRRGASEEGNGRGGARARRKTNGSRKVQAKLRVRFVPLYPGLSRSERDIHVPSLSLVGWFAHWFGAVRIASREAEVAGRREEEWREGLTFRFAGERDGSNEEAVVAGDVAGDGGASDWSRGCGRRDR